MAPRSPALLVIPIESAALRWFAAALDLDGRLTPLFCSERDDLAPYRDLPFDEQVGFLRHRFCGVLQRGCDRLFADGKKACQFVFVFEALLPETTGELTQRTAEHLAEWMLNPPVALFLAESASLRRLGGQIEAPLQLLVEASLADLSAARTNLSAWEMARQHGAWVRRE